jgi:hypothetical protein
MSIEIILISTFAIIALVVLIKSFDKDKKEVEIVVDKEPISPIETTVKSDPEPIEATFVESIPSDNEGEMPIKPQPVDCQLAQFRPAPSRFSYFDCCGNLFEGEGFQPFEKRVPVAIDVNKFFEGMDLIGENSDINC